MIRIAILTFVTVLVIACPHALGLAIPLVVAITTAKGANNGILVRDRLALERARLIDTVIFDKTGTLTEGRFGVVGMAIAPGWTEVRALALAAAIEGDSEHTIARGIRSAAELKKLNWASFLLAIAVVGIEFGFLLVYRSGWDLGIAAVLSNVVASLILVPVAIFIFKDKLNWVNVVGIFVCLAGLVMLNWKR